MNICVILADTGRIRRAVHLASDPDPFCGSFPEPMTHPGRIQNRVSLLSGKLPRPNNGNRGTLLEPDPGEVAAERLVDGASPMGPGRAQPEEIIWSSHLVDSPPTGTSIGVRCYVDRQGAWRSRFPAA